MTTEQNLHTAVLSVFRSWTDELALRAEDERTTPDDLYRLLTLCSAIAVSTRMKVLEHTSLSLREQGEAVVASFETALSERRVRLAAVQDLLNQASAVLAAEAGDTPLPSVERIAADFLAVTSLVLNTLILDEAGTPVEIAGEPIMLPSHRTMHTQARDTARHALRRLNMLLTH